MDSVNAIVHLDMGYLGLQLADGDGHAGAAVDKNQSHHPAHVSISLLLHSMSRRIIVVQHNIMAQRIIVSP